ncbi:hypothetical protein TNCV_3327401 [Trichonephila clavipes]|nr:hypothetical protein TNCV_3327401 [Trichonephila clavipes]
MLLPCGLLVDKENIFLGATPDGLVMCDCSLMGKVTKINPEKSLSTVNEQQKPRFFHEYVFQSNIVLGCQGIAKCGNHWNKRSGREFKRKGTWFKSPNWLKKESGDWPMTKIVRKSSFANRTPLAHADTSRDVLPTGDSVSETWLGNESDISIPNFNCIGMYKRPNTRAGVAIYQNSSDAVNIITPSMECSISQSDIYGATQSSVEDLCLAECVIDNG